MRVEDVLEKVSFCEDINTKIFVEEAVKAYNAGAYRACINNTWLAIVMNIVFKIEQLALLDDREAVVEKENLDAIIRKNDIPGMLKFEREILENVSKKFEFFDPIVLIDLNRIQEDRNRCSHPLLNLDKEPFVPDAELARRHLFIAVDKLLSETNVYGKSVIERIMGLVNSSVFPMKYEDIKKILLSSYLGSPKKTLVSNLVRVIVKGFLKDSQDYRRLRIYSNVMKVIFEKYRGWAEEEMSRFLSKSVDFSNLLHLKNLCFILQIDSVIWTEISNENKVLVQNYVKNLPAEDFGDIDLWLLFPYLKEFAEWRVGCASREELKQYVSFNIPNVVRKRVFELYIQSKSFAQANDFASVVCNCVSEAEKDDIVALIVGIAENSQVTDSNNFYMVKRKIREMKKIGNDEFDSFLKENGIA